MMFPTGLDPVFSDLTELVMRVLATRDGVDPHEGADELLQAHLLIASAMGALDSLHEVASHLDAGTHSLVIPPAIDVGPANTLRQALEILERAPRAQGLR